MNTPEINRITEARVVGDHTVELRFSDGFIGQIDLSPALWGPIFGCLTDPTSFRQFRVEDETIRWSNGADFCPDVLRYWCEAGGVRNQEETDSYFSRQSTAPAVS